MKRSVKWLTHNRVNYVLWKLLKLKPYNIWELEREIHKVPIQCNLNGGNRGKRVRTAWRKVILPLYCLNDLLQCRFCIFGEIKNKERERESNWLKTFILCFHRRILIFVDLDKIQKTTPTICFRSKKRRISYRFYDF